MTKSERHLPFCLAHSGCPSNAKFDISNSRAAEAKSSPAARSSCAPPVKWRERGEREPEKEDHNWAALPALHGCSREKRTKGAEEEGCHHRIPPWGCRARARFQHRDLNSAKNQAPARRKRGRPAVTGGGEHSAATSGRNDGAGSHRRRVSSHVDWQIEERGGRCRRSGGCRWPILLQRGGAAWVAPSSSAPASVVRSGVGQLCARTSHCRGGRPDLIARRHSGGGPRARPPGLPCPPPALLYRTNSPLLHHSPNIAARQKHLRWEEMYFYLSSLLGGKMPCAFALPVGEGICEARCWTEVQKCFCIACWTQP
jgi:hypothetical protein